jgi:hypothetical protein
METHPYTGLTNNGHEDVAGLLVNTWLAPL